MSSPRSILLVFSALMVLFVLGGGVAMQVGASDNSYRQVVVFSEILSLVTENYVDPVETEKLMGGAYEGMLGGLDPNGAFLTAVEVAEWKAGDRGGTAHPGLSVLRAGHSLQVVAVDPGGPADDSGVKVGDQIRSVDGRLVRDLSLGQAWRLLRGEPGSSVKLDILHPGDGFRREQVEVLRETGFGAAHSLDVERGVAILRIRDMGRVPVDQLAEELDHVRSRGIDRLLLDLRNVADLQPRDVRRLATLFSDGALLLLRNRAGELVETVKTDRAAKSWTGSLFALVNGATAGSAEALATVVQRELGGRILGESTYGLGAEAKLYELQNGSGLLVSSALWETPSGSRWNGDGVQPDQIIHGEGDEYEKVSADQLAQALEWLEENSRSDVETLKPAA